MDRGIKDEAFVRRALQEADFDMGRWIANQACFNNAATSPINEVASRMLKIASSPSVSSLAGKNRR